MNKLKLKALLAQALSIVTSVRVYVLAGLIVALFGFVALRVQRITNPPLNQDSFDERRLELEANRVRFDESTLNEVLTRSRLGPSTEPGSTGDANPFD